MLQQVSLTRNVATDSFKNAKTAVKKSSSVSMPNLLSNANYNAEKLLGAYQAYNGIKFASSISFGSSFADAFDELSKSMVTCEDEEHKKKGEVVGSRVDVSKLTTKFIDDLPRYDDAIKTTIPVEVKKEGDEIVSIKDARTQIKKGSGNKMKFEMTVRPPRRPNEKPSVVDDVEQNIEIQIVPYRIVLDENNQRHMVGTEETAYILNTKGKLMAVIEDGQNVLLTNTGKLHKKNPNNNSLSVDATQKGNVYHPFAINNIPEVRLKAGGSLGEGTEIVIGLEEGRFIPEIIESIEDFQRKIENGEIVLDTFIPAKDVKNIQIGMLAGGFGSRAEYANASSSKIMHGKKDGSNLTKGCFRTATGLTPMETSFISLHKAGYLDCSKGNFGIGKNVKFYINDSGKNGGNGSFSVDLYNTMQREGRKSLLILPNDAMSRIPIALEKINQKINSGEAAMVMVAKEVESKDAHSLGIMKIFDNGEIDDFDEKPPVIQPGYEDKNGKCFANTFQFAVSKEAFDVLNMLEPVFAQKDATDIVAGKKNKESRDWSKTYTQVLLAITKYDNAIAMNKRIKKKTGIDIPLSQLETAKAMLGNQKIYAIKSDEPWADCGTLNALYDTTMKIANGEFPLEDFERAHVLNSVNTQTGLVASTPEQKAQIEAKYDIDGQVMVVPKAKPADIDVIERNENAITRYTSVHPNKSIFK